MIINLRECTRKPPGQIACTFSTFEYLLSKKKGRDQESIRSSTTPDPGYQWESDNFTIRHHKQKSQEVSPFPAGDRKASQKDVHKNKTEIT